MINMFEKKQNEDATSVWENLEQNENVKHQISKHVVGCGMTRVGDEVRLAMYECHVSCALEYSGARSSEFICVRLQL